MNQPINKLIATIKMLGIELKKFFVDNKGKTFKTITAIVLLLTTILSIINIIDFFKPNIDKSQSNNDDNLIKKIIIGLSIEDIDNLLGNPVTTTECSASRVERIVNRIIDRPNNVIISAQSNRYYILDKYIVRCVFDGEKLVAYFFTIRNRGDVLPNDMSEIIFSGLGEKTYYEILEFFNMFFYNIPTSNNQFMYYGELVQQRPMDNLMYCSLDYGFNNCEKNDKELEYDYYDLANAAEKFNLVERWFRADILGIQNYVLRACPNVHRKELLEYEEDRKRILPNTVGIIANGYECCVEPMDGMLSRTAIIMIKEY